MADPTNPIRIAGSANLAGQVDAARVRMAELASRVSELRESVKDAALPTLRRRALAALTRSSLEGQGVAFDSSRLLAGLTKRIGAAP